MTQMTRIREPRFSLQQRQAPQGRGLCLLYYHFIFVTRKVPGWTLAQDVQMDGPPASGSSRRLCWNQPSWGRSRHKTEKCGLTLREGTGMSPGSGPENSPATPGAAEKQESGHFVKLEADKDVHVSFPFGRNLSGKRGLPGDSINTSLAHGSMKESGRASTTALCSGGGQGRPAGNTSPLQPPASTRARHPVNINGRWLSSSAYS